jgi:metal-responsive CopG/Arc/MetJ family transcriptional regulator
MTTNQDEERDHVLRELARNKEALAEHEREWQNMRAQSRALSMALITQHGYSMNAVAQLSGHHRATIKIWLDIHNAETKKGRRNEQRS